MKNITYLDNDTLPECVYKNKQNILAIIDEIAKTYGLDFKGEYSATETYTKNNVAVYNNKTYVYISTVTTSNILPTNTQFWALWIDPKPGAQGEKGEPGEKGADGAQVESVVKVSTVENVDTYRMTFSNGYTADFTVTNGQNGQNGKGIESISLVSSTESSSTYRINYGDGLTFDFTVQNGVSPTITIGSVTTVDSTENARVENSGTDKNVVLDFYLPKGEKGDPGVSVNGEIVSEQTADSNTKTYSVGFVNNFIISQFANTINGMQAVIDKKLELSETSEFIYGSVPAGSETKLEFQFADKGTYAVFNEDRLVTIFTTVKTSGIKIINIFNVAEQINIVDSKLMIPMMRGTYYIQDNKLKIERSGITVDLGTSTITETTHSVSANFIKLIKLN